MNEYLKILREILLNPRTFQCDFVRYQAALIAEMASRGHISCVIQGMPKSRWYVTRKGLGFLRHNRIEV